jgi:type II secretory pathway component PulF
MSSTFAYRAVDAAGRRLHGVEAASNASALAQSLEDRGLVVVDLEQAETSAAQSGGIRFGQKREVLEVTRALAALLPAGLPIARALTAATHVTSGPTRAAIEAVRTRVERGESLADSLAEHPGLFSPLAVGMVRAGERSGNLDSAFGRLSQQLERDEQLRARLLSISIYPLLLGLAGGASVLVLLLFVIPRFATLLTDTGIALPRSTALLLAVSGAMREYWPVLLVTAACLTLLFVWSRTNEDGRRVSGKLALSLPLIRSYRQHALGARFARLTSVLLVGGAPLLSALDDAVESIGDPNGRDEIGRIRDRVREGRSLHQAVSEGKLFPDLLLQLIAVGEESGRLTDFLSKAADILEERTERVLQRVVTAAEPAMIIVFGGIVGFVALSLLQAIYSVNAGAIR